MVYELRVMFFMYQHIHVICSVYYHVVFDCRVSVMGWVGSGNNFRGLGWIGFQKVDRRGTGTGNRRLSV